MRITQIKNKINYNPSYNLNFGRKPKKEEEADLQQTLKELKSRLSGEYKEGSYQFYYIDFLKNDKVLLDEDALPILDEVFELPDFSVLSRIQLHCTEKEQEFAERMQEIFEGEDDYGPTENIGILTERGDHSIILKSSRNIALRTEGGGIWITGGSLNVNVSKEN